MKKQLLLLLGISTVFSGKLFSQNFYTIDSIQQIEILFSQSNWDYILDTAKQGSDSYTMAFSVTINGVQFDSVGVKYKGNSSYNPTNAKNPLHIELDHFKTQDYLGYKDIKLSNGYHEPSSVREVLLYKMAQQYMPASNANFAQVSINGSPMGLYTNVEAVTKTFLESRFYSDNNTFVFADNGGCNLVYKGTDTTLYYTPYTMKSDFGWTDLANLCDTLGNNINAIENILDVDRALWMIAFTNVTVTLDSYLGQSIHNYYIYQDHNERFNPILWDLNGGLGIFNKANMGPALTVAQMQTMSPVLHENDSLWPMVKNLLAVPMFNRMYVAHMRTIVNENFMNSSYFYYSQYLQSVIDTAIQSDPNSFYTYTEFIDNLTIDVIDGPKTIPGISSFMETRKAYLNSTSQFQQVPPVITSVEVSDTIPLINDVIFITTIVTNATQVYAGTRSSIMDKFSRQLMFDDGLHGDGAAGDNVFGIDVVVESAYLQYYIYAENNNAGMFSPERAEYEYYTVNAEKGVVINELMADNALTQQDDYSEYNDWIEIYNNSSSTIDLSGYYLSDDVSSPEKWQFPSGTTINANGFLIIWADGDTTQTIGLHTNFKLSAAGEAVILSDNSLRTIDEISFPSIATDITYGRYPNGTGNFSFLSPTYNNVNSQPISVTEIENEYFDFSIYPNPANSFLTIETESEEQFTFYIYNNIGGLMEEGKVIGKQIIEISSLSAGLYLIRTNDKTKKFLVAR